VLFQIYLVDLHQCIFVLFSTRKMLTLTTDNMNKRNLLLVALGVLLFAPLVAQTTNSLQQDWHHQAVANGFYGVNSVEAYTFLKETNRTNLKPIVVAVIDGDLDTNHEDLKNNLWTAKKAPKGYKDVKHGWNFLGTTDGKQISKVGTEAFREYKRLRPKFENTKPEDCNTAAEKAEFAYFLQVKKDAKIQSYLNFFPYIKLTFESYRLTDSTIKAQNLDVNTFILKDLQHLKSADSVVQEYIDAAQRSSMRYAETEKWTDLYALQVDEFNTAVKRIKSLDDLSNPRFTIGDDMKSLKDKYYGNNQLIDSASYHGTFVGGLIAADRNNKIGIDGIASNAVLMGLRAVPDGDEFDKDIALAIRFAVDNGANIINMSFGKYYSPNSEWVTDAIAYALKNNVLVVQAAGNDNKNLDTITSYPIQPKTIKAKENSYLRIGASDYKGAKSSFSNYGSQTVDFFAPGEKITSTSTFNEYKTANGTSFSTPIVSGVAALVWGAYPSLKAYQVAEILKLSAEKNKSSQLNGYAKTAGIVDAYEALKIAKDYVKK